MSSIHSKMSIFANQTEHENLQIEMCDMGYNFDTKVWLNSTDTIEKIENFFKFLCILKEIIVFEASWETLLKELSRWFEIHSLLTVNDHTFIVHDTFETKHEMISTTDTSYAITFNDLSISFNMKKHEFIILAEYFKKYFKEYLLYTDGEDVLKKDCLVEIIEKIKDRNKIIKENDKNGDLL